MWFPFEFTAKWWSTKEVHGQVIPLKGVHDHSLGFYGSSWPNHGPLGVFMVLYGSWEGVHGLSLSESLIYRLCSLSVQDREKIKRSCVNVI